MTPEDFSALLKARYTARDFRPDPIPSDVLDGILDDARFSPSWSNTRGYRLAVAQGEQLERIKESYLEAFDRSMGKYGESEADYPTGDYDCWRPYPDDLQSGRRTVGFGLYKHMGIERHDMDARNAAARRNFEFFGAPVGAFLFVHDGLQPFTGQDGGLMLQTLLLAAKVRGVDSCCLGALTSWRHPVEAEFEIPENYKLITGFALGYASDDPVNDFRAEHLPVGLLKPKN